MPEITIQYSPRAVFRQFHDAKARWAVLCCHRRAGKTVSTINHLIRDALRTPGSRFAYIAPTYKQAKRVAWDYVKEYSRPVPGTSFNEVELRADYPNGSRVQLFGADNPDSLRGLALWGVVFDEAEQQPPNIFGEIISPALADHSGYAIWIGTIRGKNHLWRLHEDHKADPDWFTMYLKASESKILPEAELEVQRRNLTDEEYAQEYELEPTAAIKGAYYIDVLRQARKEKRITNVPYEVIVPVNTYWDLGIGDSTTILFVQRVGMENRIIDAYTNSGKSLDHYVRELRAKPYIYGTHYLPHDARARELGTGMSRFELMAQYVHEPIEIVKTIPVDDGINAVRSIFNTVWIDETKCQGFIDAIEQYRKEWDDEMNAFRPKPLHDWTSDYADALRYFAVSSREFDTRSRARDTMGGTSDHGDDEFLIPG